MLLYTRVAPPKVPKKRSRAGCNYCKEKKKKCDEARPRCSRCEEHDTSCVYEPIKPRQRRKRENTAACTDAPTPSSGVSIRQWQQQQRKALGWPDDVSVDDEDFVSVIDAETPRHISIPEANAYSQMQAALSWSPADTTEFSPMTPLTSSNFDFNGLDGPSNTQDNQDEVEEVVRQDVTVMTHSVNSKTLARRYSNLQEGTPRLEFCCPAFAEFSDRKNRRHLVDHFCNVLSHLIVFREENGNPFQQLVLPLSHSSPAVMDSIYALASAHLEYRGVQNAEKSDYFHGKAIQHLARLIEDGGGEDRNELLAAIMLLVYYEVLVQKGRSNIVDGHLKGAMTIMGNYETRTDPTGVFLERAFRFYDVIAALSFGTAPLSSTPGRGSLSSLPPLDSRGATSPVGSVDTLLGMATTLWPIIHRLSNLVSVKEDLDTAVATGQVSKAAVLRTELETTASAIQVALKHWQPMLPPDWNMSTSERSRLQSILNNALAYRHSAFVYLHRTIYGHSRSHPCVQDHTHLSLTHCVGTVSGDGPMSALLWPLFVASCEATSLEDRELARKTFNTIDRVQGMANIERAWCIVQEVWRRADEEEEEELKKMALKEMQEQLQLQSNGIGQHSGADLWRRVSQEMGVNIVFG